MNIIRNKISAIPVGKNPRRMMSPPISAMTRLERGPAPATIASLKRPGRKLYGLYGTGFAQPKRIGALVSTRTSGKIMLPMGSR